MGHHERFEIGKLDRPKAPRLAHAVLASVLAACFACNHLLAAWTTPVTISGVNADNPNVIIDSSGDMLAVWKGFNGSNYIIQSSTALFQSDWSPPVDLSASGQDAFFPDASIDSSTVQLPDGSVAVWSRSNGTYFVIQALINPFNGTVANVSVADQDAVFPQIASNASGNSVIVWMKQTGVNYVIQAAATPSRVISHRPVTWSTPVDLLVSGGNASAPQVALDPHGNATAVWVFYEGTHYLIQTASCPFGSGWSPPLTLSSIAGDASAPQLAVDDAGNVTVVWQLNDGASTVIQTRFRDAAGNWGASETLSNSGQDAFVPQVDVDASGNAVAVWEGSVSSQSIIQSASRIGGIWTASTDLSSGIQNSVSPQVGVDALGNAVAVWKLSIVSNSTIQAAVLPFSGTWSSTVDISTNGEDSGAPQLAMNARGEYLAAWRNNALTQIQVATNSFVSVPNPPTDFLGTVRKSKFLNKTEYVLTMTWRASPSDTTLYYLIYKNGQVVQRVTVGSSLSFTTKIFSSGDTNFMVSAVTSDGLASKPVQLRIVND